MSVYDRQERKIEFSLACTPRRVGPGCYNLDGDAKKRTLQGQKSAPFDTSGKIGTGVLPSAAPGPVYNPKVSDFNSKHDRVVGGRALANRAERFVYKANDMPGPGTYDIMQKTRWMEKGAVSMDPPTQPEPEPETVQTTLKEKSSTTGSRAMMVSRLPRPRGIPSIPDSNRLFGYRLNKDSTLTVNRPAPTGPKIYGGELPKFDTEKFRGCKFGQRTSLRDTNWAGPPGPAPNEYSPSIPKHKSFCQTQPLLASAWGLREPGQAVGEKKVFSDMPAPNAYDVRGDVGTDHEEANAPFNVGSKRFVYKYNDNPGPGSYKTAKSGIGDAPTVAPLSFTDPKFGKGDSESTPGPNHYEPPIGFGEEIMKKAEAPGAPHGAFGVSQGRDFNPGSKEETPAPNAYHLKWPTAGPDPKYTRRLTSSFASRSAQGLDPRYNAGFGNPGPNHYKSEDAFRRMRTTTRAPARSKEAKERQGCFLVHGKRFQDVVDFVPAPGTYDPPIDCKCMPKGRFVVHDEKLKSHHESAGPGPCYYWPKNGNVGTLKTYNTTLGFCDDA